MPTRTTSDTRIRPRARMTSLLTVAATGNFRWFAAAKLVSLAGTSMQRTTVDWLVLQLSRGSGTAVGIAAGLQVAPTLVAGLWAGALADRLPCRRAIIATQSLAALVALAGALLAGTEALHLWQLYVLAVVLGTLTAMENPLHQRLLRHMVGVHDVCAAVGVHNAIFNISRLIGPVAAGLIIATAGAGAVFVANATSFLAVIIVLAVVRTGPLRTSTPAADAGRGTVGDALRYVRSRPDLTMTLGLTLVCCALLQPLNTIALLMSTVEFGADTHTFALPSSALAAGAVLGALVAGQLTPSTPVMVGSATGFGTAIILAGAAPNYPTFLVAVGMAWIPAMAANTVAVTGIQLATPETKLGRVMAVWFVASTGATALGAPLTGRLAQHCGARMAILSLGATAVLAIAVFTRSRSARHTTATTRPPDLGGTPTETSRSTTPTEES